MQLEIVTPKGEVLDDKADEVVLPGVEGEFGVLSGHVPLLASLKAGLLTYRSGATHEAFAIWSGYAQVTQDGVVRVLAVDCVRKAQVSVQDVEAELAAAREATDLWEGPIDAKYQALRDRVAWAEARIALVNLH